MSSTINKNQKEKERQPRIKQYFLTGNSISNIFLNQNTSIFKIYEAILNEDSSSPKEIYIVQLKFLDFSSKLNINTILNTIINSFPMDFILTHSSLQRIGFIQNINENNISLVYLKEGNTLFAFDSFLTEYSGTSSYETFKLQMIYDLFKSTSQMHRIGKKIGLINPSLLFFNKQTNSFSFVDFIFDELISYSEKANISQVLPYFGYYSYDDIDLLDNGYSEISKEYKDNYFKTDNVLLITIMNFLFTSKKISKKKEEVGVIKSIDPLLNELQKEFLTMNHKLTNYLSYISDYSIKSLIEDCVLLEYSKIKTSDYILQCLEKIIKKEITSEVCHDCQDLKYNKMKKNDERQTVFSENDSLKKDLSTITKLTSPSPNNINIVYDYYNKKYIEKIGKRINCLCFHLLCKCCYDSHICEKIVNKSYFQVLDRKEENRIKVSKVKEKSETSIKLKTIKLISYFESEVEPYVNKINQSHTFLERLIRYEDEVINSIIDYINTNIDSIEDSERRLIEEQITKAKERLFLLLSQIELVKLNKIPSEKIDYKNIMEKSKIIESMSMTMIDKEKDKDKEIMNLSLNDDEEDINNNLNETIKGHMERILDERNFYINAGHVIDSWLLKYKNRVFSTFDYKDQSNSQSKQFTVLIKELSRYSVNYKHELQTLFKNDFQHFTRQLEILYEFLSVKEIKKAEEYTNNEDLTCIAHIKDNTMKIYNTLSNKVNSIDFLNNFKFSRFLNMSKNKILVSGGVNSDMTPNNQFLIIKYSHFFNNQSSSPQNNHTSFDVENENDAVVENEISYKVDRPKALESMNYNHDQHCFLRINEFEVLIIGGFTTKACEIYSFLSKKWERIACLNQFLYNSSACVFNEIDVYVFFGLIGNESNKRNTEISYSFTIEKLRLYSKDSMDYSKSWTIINVKLPEKFPSIILSACYFDSEDEIILFGGKVICLNDDERKAFGYKAYTNKSIGFNIKTQEIRNMKNRLSKEVCFTQNMIKMSGSLICMFSENSNELITIE